MTSISSVMSLLGPVLASATMSVNLWLPFYLGLGLLGCALPLIALLRSSPSHHDNDQHSVVDCNSHVTEETRLLEGDSQDHSPGVEQSTQSNTTSRILSEVKETLRSFLRKTSLHEILVVVLLVGLAKSSMDILILYLSKRYNKTFAQVCQSSLLSVASSLIRAQVGYLLSIKAAVNIFLFTALVPLFLRLWLRTFRRSQIDGDFFGAQASLLLACVGTFCLALADRLWMAIVGETLVPTEALFSLLASHCNLRIRLRHLGIHPFFSQVVRCLH